MIGIYNSSDNYPLELSVFKNINSLNIEGIDSLLVYWKKNIDNEKSSFEQLALINLCLKKGLPIKIIDLNREMIYEEALTSIKSGISLYEPYMISRSLFNYLPEPVLLDFPPLDNLDRSINVCYHTSDMYNFSNHDINITAEFEKCKIYLNCDNIEYRKYGRISPETFKAASAGCMPLIPVQHRLMHNLVSTVGKAVNSEDIQYYINRSSSISYGYCYNFIENIRNMYPEFGYEYFKDVILNANNSSQI